MNPSLDLSQNFLDKFNLPFILFFVSLVIYVAYVFAILYHLIRFGIGVKPKLIALIFFIGSVLLLMIAFGAYSTIDINTVAAGLERTFGSNLKNLLFFNIPKLP